MKYTQDVAVWASVAQRCSFNSNTTWSCHFRVFRSVQVNPHQRRKNVYTELGMGEWVIPVSAGPPSWMRYGSIVFRRVSMTWAFPATTSVGVSLDPLPPSGSAAPGRATTVLPSYPHVGHADGLVSPVVDEEIKCDLRNCKFSPKHTPDCAPPQCTQTCWQYHQYPQQYLPQIDKKCPKCSGLG
ncbi:hypothetical protein L210DRAFT_2393079 [Boletus edulis BED1]|uniref:Uncharacterized protein n=1 Tax=Boletus edulis BED1 TaxID=1328754 RepID=A0AAD4GL15_BOLED|nr:hypothetical protein L210DRAFT_2393079 [Boletus edulis BED1]